MLERLKTCAASTAMILTMALIPMGCDDAEVKSQSEAPSPTDGTTGKSGEQSRAADSEKTADPAPAETAAGGEVPEACQNYQKALCEAAGDPSYLCKSFKTVVPVLPGGACTEGLKDISNAKAKITEIRKNCDSLADRLCKDLGAETESCRMVRDKTPEFPPEQCTQMVAEYGQVLASLQEEEEKNKPMDASQRSLIEAGDAASFGAPNAKVTIVEFSDFECPYCSKAADVATQVKSKYTTDVRFVFRHYPLPFHKKAHLASQASLAANEQGKFWEFHDLIFENQRSLDRQDLEAHAKKLGLNMKTFKAALDKNTFKDAVDADLKLGTQVSVNGTPTMFINGRRATNPTDFAAVSRAIDAELAK
jgi:protein-disulfide isomerase